MTSFGWKRKVGEKVSRSKAAAFEQEAQDDDDQAIRDGGVDWLTLAPQAKVICLEDAVSKSKRLREEGSILAAAERFWEALKKWDEALQLTPNEETIYDMKSQAYMSLGEVFPAAQAAMKSVELNPCWWPAYQTLGRAQLGMGEVRKAVRSFSKAIHINPAEQELWEDDLEWANSLLIKKKLLEAAALEAVKEQSENKIVELDSDDKQCTTVDTYTPQSSSKDSQTQDLPAMKGSKDGIGGMLANYIKMRDVT